MRPCHRCVNTQVGRLPRRSIHWGTSAGETPRWPPRAWCGLLSEARAVVGERARRAPLLGNALRAGWGGRREPEGESHHLPDAPSLEDGGGEPRIAQGRSGCPRKELMRCAYLERGHLHETGRVYDEPDVGGPPDLGSEQRVGIDRLNA